jgi:dihydrodipicolinate synthase/N-acetylneuraminate lyase
MKTTAVTKNDLEASVLAVPPLARNRDLSLNAEQNRKLIRYLKDGGVTTLMYGGNANFYNLGVFDYAQTVEALAEIADPDSWVIPSVGPDFGKAMDQAKILRDLKFPTCMVLPLNFPATPAGAAQGIARIAERFGKPVIAYLKAENYLRPEDLGALARDGVICAIKYAFVLDDPLKDNYLKKVLDQVSRDLVISGIGERPAIDHLRDFKLTGFTSGSVCVAPYLSASLLHALKAKDYAGAEKIRAEFLPLEDLRDGISPLRVLHEAVTLSGIADMGPMFPMLSNIDDSSQLARIKAAAASLRQKDETAKRSKMDSHRAA